MSEGPSSEQHTDTEPRACQKCGTPLQPAQDWCLQCGAGADGGRTGPGWRSAAVAVGAAAVLALGAAAAAYAALKQSSPQPSSPAITVAQTPPATTSTTATATSTSATASTASQPGEGLPSGSSKPPKIPSTAATPKTGGTSSEGDSAAEAEEAGSSTGQENGGGHSGKGQQGSGKETTAKEEEEACKASSSTTDDGEGTSSANGEGTETETSTTEASATQTTSGSEEEVEEEATCQGEGGKQAAKPAPILLKAEAASTYDPNGYPESGFEGPQLAIDGVATTAWTAAPAPELAPKVQAGLLLDLKTEHRIAKVGLISKTLGMTIQVYGTTQRKPPKSIAAKGWVKLSGVHLVEQRSSSIELRRTPKIRQLLIWVLRAPEVEAKVEGEEVDEAAAINEVALYEAK